MSGRPGKIPGPLRYAGDPETRGGFRAYLIEFIDWMGAMHFSVHTVKKIAASSSATSSTGARTDPSRGPMR